MQSNNPIFNRSEAFNSPQGGTAYADPYAQPSTGAADPYGQYGDPSTWGTGAPAQKPTAGRMTIDSVVQKTSMSVGVVILTAAITWIMIGDTSGGLTSSQLSTASMAAMVGGGLAFVLSLLNSFKKVISPALVIAFAAAEGVALGAISMLFNGMYPGIVTGAVLGTFAAFAGTLAAYKFFAIKVTDKFRKGVTAAMFGMVGLSLMAVVMSFFGVTMFSFSEPLGLVFSIVGLVLGVFMLIMDFDFVEQGIAYGADERESWTAAFAMTVSLVWIYTNLLRILAFFQSND